MCTQLSYSTKHTDHSPWLLGHQPWDPIATSLAAEHTEPGAAGQAAQASDICWAATGAYICSVLLTAGIEVGSSK